MKTIRKNATKLINEIARGTYKAERFTLENGFQGRGLNVADDCGVALAKHLQDALAVGARLYTATPGKYTLRLHSNDWIELYSAKVVA